MTEAAARTTANVLLTAAAFAAGYVVLANPRLRRVASRLTRVWLGASVPIYLLTQVGRAWAETGREV